MNRQPATTDGRSNPTRGAYVLVVRGADGLPRVESFDDLARYRARIQALESTGDSSLSIAEIASLLDS